MLPHKTTVDFRSGRLEPATNILQRRLSDMPGLYADAAAVQQILKSEGDRLIYEVYLAATPEEAGHLPQCTTLIYPGQVGDEYHMTKGHFHAKRERPEVYLGLSGQGYLLMQTDEGQVEWLLMEPGTVAYIPPFWAHRTLNSGPLPFSFLSVWPGDAGHDYQTIARRGFARLVVNQKGSPTLVANPHYSAL